MAREARESGAKQTARGARDVYLVYLLMCADATLYCGIAKDVAARLAQHNAGKGARYTKPAKRRPARLMWARRCRDKSRALRLEYAIKQLSRAEKLALDRRGLAAMVRRLR